MIVETGHGFLLGGLGLLLDGDSERAWAEKHVRIDPDLSYLLGNYVEADNANDNGHIFPLEDLEAGRETLLDKPLNMLHHGRYVVGTFVGQELVAPGEVEAAGQYPVLEALAAFWKHNFPDEYQLVKRAHGDGNLFFSMEAIPESVSCPEAGCGLVAKYTGPKDPLWCEHMQKPAGRKRLLKPRFNAGAIIIPPVRPGWKRADISQLSQLLKDSEAAERVYAQVAEEAPHLDPKAWEWVMAQLMEQARDFSTKTREDLAKSGKAMPGGSFPIPDVDALKRAIKLAGKAKDPAAARRHIIKRARALGVEDLIPDSWKS